MARVNLRTVANKTGTTYTAGNTTFLYAEDYEAIKDAIDDASSGINTEQVEVGGTAKINSSGEFVNASKIGNDGGTVVIGNSTETRFEIDEANHTVKLYINNVKVKEWS